MRVLLTESGSPAPGTVLDPEGLREVYAAPRDRAWLRVNFVSTLDGAATGADGRSGSINTPPDHRVFRLLRELADLLVVGTGTVRVEGYRVPRDEEPEAPVLAVVSHRGVLPPALADMQSPHGSALLVTRSGAHPEDLAAARRVLGEENVVLAGTDTVDLAAARKALEERGFRQVLCEGGPTLFGSMLEADVVDELDLTLAPTIVGGSHPRIVHGGDLALHLEPIALVEEDGTVLGRWRVVR